MIQLYDPDIPLFPLQYFHIIPKKYRKSEEISHITRIYGYINRINLLKNDIKVSITTNKDLINDPLYCKYKKKVKFEIINRLGLSNPLTVEDVQKTFIGTLANRNEILLEIWRKVVGENFDNKLPYGRFFDKTFGLIRFIASFMPPAGRKSELIMTQYFYYRFGEPITVEDTFLKVEFRLFPSYFEFINHKLNLFPKFNSLAKSVEQFQNAYCQEIKVSKTMKFSRFRNPYMEGGAFHSLGERAQINQEKLLKLIFNLDSKYRKDLIEVFNAFDKGPFRTLIFLNLFGDIYNRRFNPKKLDSLDFEIINDKLGGFSQSPKVIEIYSQQCFGNINALPLDTWITTFLDYPLNYLKTKGKVANIFHNSSNLGKTERLLWITAQSRKIHSPICNDVLWCIKFDSSRNTRGANPLACSACQANFRIKCPSFQAIKSKMIEFNKRSSQKKFVIKTHQNMFVSCKRFNSKNKGISDDFTPVDAPDQFKSYPQKRLHNGEEITVKKFVEIYSNNYDQKLEKNK